MVVGTIGDIAPRTAHLEPPAVIVIGEVVALQGLLHDGGVHPLAGERQLVAAAGRGEARALLERHA